MTSPLLRALRRPRTLLQRMKYRIPGAHPTAFLSRGCRLRRDLVAGPYSFIGPGCDLCQNVRIGKYSMLAPRVAIVGSDHRIDLAAVPMIFAGRPVHPITTIEDDVWVGFGVIILAGVHLARGSVVAAGAVVTNDVPAYTVSAGVPARVIRERFSESDALVHDRMLDGPARAGSFASRKRYSPDEW